MDTKVCSKCKEELPLEAFYTSKKSKDGRQSYCTPCKKVNSAARYKAAPEKWLDRNRRQRARNYTYVEQYLREHPCVDCGNSDIRVLEFDHVHGEKAAEVSDLARGYSLERLIEEIAKCEIRCANCHRIVTYERARSRRSTWTE